GQVLSDTGPDLSRADKLAPPELNREQDERAALLAGFPEAMRMALRALRTNIFRTILTLLGIVIGVGSVVSMMAIGEGAKQQVVAQISAMGTNLLLVRPAGRNMRGYNGAIATLTPDDATALSKLPDVEAAIPEITGGATVRLGDVDYQTQVDATSPQYADMKN